MNTDKTEPTLGSLKVRNTGSYWRIERFQFVPLEGNIWEMIKSDLRVNYVVDATPREFNLILKALRAFGGHGEVLAAELESQRAKNTKALIKRFASFVNLQVLDDSDEQ